MFLLTGKHVRGAASSLTQSDWSGGQATFTNSAQFVTSSGLFTPTTLQQTNNWHNSSWAEQKLLVIDHKR